MKPEAIQVAIDILRELGHEDMARWVEHPEAVRQLLKRAEFERVGEDGEAPRCVDCYAAPWEAHGGVFREDGEGRDRCRIAAAWRALGDPRGADDIERAHEEALIEHRRRVNASSVIPSSPWVTGDWDALVRDNPYAAAAMDLIAPPPVAASALSNPFAAMALGRTPYRLASESQQAAQERDPVARALEDIRLAIAMAPVRRVHVHSRVTSDARGMEAVEDEARRLVSHVELPF